MIDERSDQENGQEKGNDGDTEHRDEKEDDTVRGKDEHDQTQLTVQMDEKGDGHI